MLHDEAVKSDALIENDGDQQKTGGNPDDVLDRFVHRNHDDDDIDAVMTPMKLPL